jgi:hypothetical protein
MPALPMPLHTTLPRVAAKKRHSLQQFIVERYVLYSTALHFQYFAGTLKFVAHKGDGWRLQGRKHKKLRARRKNNSIDKTPSTACPATVNIAP